jgi:hypothetical protein
MSTGCKLYVEVKDGLIIARIVGEPTFDFFGDCIARLKQVVKDTGIRKILYDLLSTDTPYMTVILHGTKTAIETPGKPLLRAVVVPNTKLSYMTRIIFGEENCRVFYQDMDGALEWLKAAD